MTITSATPAKRNFRDALIEEAKKALVLSLYFGVWFCALAFLAATMLDERPIPLTIFGLAIIKAAITAKFMLIGQAIYPIQVSRHHGITKSLLLESIFYLMIVLALNFIEAGIDGVFHGKNFFDSMAAFENADPIRILAVSIVYWLIVFPYLVFNATLLIMGKDNLISLLFGAKDSTDK
jgi:hypothetical protein